MSLAQFLRIFWAHRLILLIGSVTAAIAAAVAVPFMPVSYEASSRLVLDLIKPDPVTGERLSPGFAKAYSQTQASLLQDPQIVARIVDQTGLMADDEIRAEFDARGGGNVDDFRLFIAERIVGNIQTRLVVGTNILEIAYRSDDPAEARRIANLLRTAYVEASTDFRRVTARETAEWYVTQAEQARATLREAEERKTAFEKEHGLLLSGQTDIDTQRLEALAGPTAEGAAGANTVAKLRADLADVDARISQASRVLGPRHPEFLSLQEQRTDLAAAIAAEQAAFRATQSSDSQSAFAAQRDRVLAQRQNLDILRGMQTEAELAREHYVTTARRAAQAEQEAQAPETGITLLSTASVPARIGAPGAKVVVTVAATLGLIMAGLMALLFELLYRRVRTEEDLTTLDVPLLGVVSRA